MVSVIDRQVRAFDASATAIDQDALVRASDEGCDAQEVHDLIKMAVFTAQLLEDHVAKTAAAGTLPTGYVAAGENLAELLLVAMAKVRKVASRFIARGHAFETREFDDAVVKVRDSLCAIQDMRLTPAERERNAAIVGRFAQAEVSASERPPQKWFEEDVTGLRQKSW